MIQHVFKILHIVSIDTVAIFKKKGISEQKHQISRNTIKETVLLQLKLFSVTTGSHRKQETSCFLFISYTIL